MLLFEPLSINGYTLKNRIVFPPTYTCMGVGSEAALQYYCERAAGGAGLVIVEGTNVNEFRKKDFPARMRRLSAAIKENGAAAVLQLVVAPVFDGEETWISRRNGKRAISGPEIRQLVQGFAWAARESAAAGFAGIDLHGAHGFFWNKLFSPIHNKRTDEYGGSLANRMRPGLEAVAAIRAAVPAGFMIFYRHTPDEGVSGGYTTSDSIAFAEKLVAAGIDVLDLSPGQMPDGTLAGYAAMFKKTVPVPIMTVNGFNDPAAAEKALQEGHCDLVGICRGLIADPQWPNKVREGRRDEIIRCTGCNKGCYGNINKGRPIKCVQDKDQAADHIPVQSPLE